MKYNFLFGLPAILLMTMVFTPAFAGAPPDQSNIVSSQIFENPSLVSAKINVVSNPIPTGPGFAIGSGVLTSGTLGVTTSHAGVLDSITQNGNPNSAIIHNHYVNLGPAPQTQAQGECSDLGADAIVTSLSYESPGIAMWPENMYKMWEVPKASPPGQYHDSLQGDVQNDPDNLAQVDYTLGNLGPGYQTVTFSLQVGSDGVCVFVEDSDDAELNPLVKIAGALLQIDTTTLLISGAATSAMWLLPIVVSVAGLGAVIIRKKF